MDTIEPTSSSPDTPSPSSAAAIEIPLGLRLAIEASRTVLFVGAGLGRYFKTADGGRSPTGAELASELVAQFGLPPSEDLSKVAEVIDMRGRRRDLEAHLRRRLSNLEPDDCIKWIPSIRWKAIFTTNYEDGLQRAYAKAASPRQQPITVSETAHVADIDPRYEVGIYHLHGTLFGSSEPHIVITQSDYAKYAERRRMLFELLRKEFATSTILYIGYANEDPDWRLLLSELAEEFYPSALPPSYRIAPNTPALDSEILKGRGIDTIDCAYHDFVAAAAAALLKDEAETDKLSLLQAAIPESLQKAFASSPAPVARLLTSWSHVNTAPFFERPNLSAFLKGDRPNWGLLSRQQYFERDIDEDLYDTLLDFATGTPHRPVIELLLGPAGYGTTTVLMAAATKLVQDRAGTVLFLKPGAPVLEGDIEFAVSAFEDNVFLVPVPKV